ncbi:MAG: outer membrane lipoprotein carrier protein LolA [Acidobacteria bacterium]|nr:outer membrane lipoprotein carrier protein LolA [Acidobacteriota bacterium]MBV9184228.1 outer membrane lipoprotein carrier protein LolA [Acidobacteriota bacterium]
MSTFRTKFFALALGAAALAMPAVAARTPKADSLDEVIRKVQLAQAKTNTLQADFRQEKSLALMAKPEVSTGRFVYSKPNNVLWTYDAPKRVTMLIADGMLTTYYPDLKKAERIEVKRYQDRIFKYMGASGAIDELGAWFNFTFTNTSDKPYYALDLDPKSKTIAKRVRHIRIYIDKTSYLTTQFEYTEGDGDKTRYEFTNVKVNAPVEQSRFTLQLPSSVRVEQMKLQ